MVSQMEEEELAIRGISVDSGKNRAEQAGVQQALARALVTAGLLAFTSKLAAPSV
jgi:hypothetical protein